MKQPDEFSEYYADLLEGRYDCVDRIVLTGYFPLGQQGGGFRYWWRKLTGSDESLDQAHLLAAGEAQSPVHAYARRRGIPLRHCAPDVRKHELAEQYRPRPKLYWDVPDSDLCKAPALV